MTDPKADLPRYRRRRLHVLWWSLLALGGALRLIPFLRNRSFWLDEAMLALNFTATETVAQLLGPLEFNQQAPVGFLLSTQGVISMLGASDWVFRLIPLACGLAALLLFAKLADSRLQGLALFVVVGLFAINRHLIYYASEFKQYSGDVLMTVGLVYLASEYSRSPREGTRWLLTLVGVGALWFSHPSIFVLIGVLIFLACSGSRARTLAPSAIVWGLSFAANYFWFLGRATQNASLLEFHDDSFPPWPISIDAIDWYLSDFLRLFEGPGGFYLVGIPLLLAVLGLVSLYASRNPDLALYSSIGGLTFVAALLHRYPLSNRLLLFLLPLLLLLVGEGLTYLKSAVEGSRKSTAVVTVVVGLLVLHPVLFVARDSLHWPPRPDLNPVLDFLETTDHGSDQIAFVGRAATVFSFYEPQHTELDAMSIPSAKYPTEFQSALASLSGRYWLALPRSSFSDLALDAMDEKGNKVSEHERGGYRLVLYEF